ncbi:MAG: hypothetical protein IPP88_22835 [Betaproteobacteria bacterium]|nr:hypothetical protein [Betaproteobacteria bacterium]
MTLIPTILCGGTNRPLAGFTRSAIRSRSSVLPMAQSLQKAFLHDAAPASATEMITVTNRGVFFKTEDRYREINKAKDHDVVHSRTVWRWLHHHVVATATSLGHGEDAILLVLPTDHLIADPPACTRAAAAKLRRPGQPGDLWHQAQRP